MNILLSHFRVGETDGVSLEMDKWRWVLESLGHTCFYLAGSKGAITDDSVLVCEQMHYRLPENDRIVQGAYHDLGAFGGSEQALEQAVEALADQIHQRTAQLIRDHNIDLILPNNIWSLGWGLPAAIGLYRAVKETGIQVLCHHHDFHWERVRYSNPTCDYVAGLLQDYFPPHDPEFKHAVINSLGQQELKQRCGIDSIIVPNVFDFACEAQGPAGQSEWKLDDYNRDLREKLGLRPHDLMLLQATRIDPRKAIELAIDCVGEMNRNREQLEAKPLYDGRRFTPDSRIVLVLAGLPEGNDDYIAKLKQRAERQGVELAFVNHLIEHSRETGPDGKKHYSLWDTYVHADLVTYPSILEGWGNQLLEAMYAKKPVVLYQYPVYDADIGPTGLKAVSFGNTHTWNEQGLVEVEPQMIKRAAKEVICVLQDPERYQQETDFNSKLGLERYSLGSLAKCLAAIINH